MSIATNPFDFAFRPQVRHRKIGQKESGVDSGWIATPNGQMAPIVQGADAERGLDFFPAWDCRDRHYLVAIAVLIRWLSFSTRHHLS